VAVWEQIRGWLRGRFRLLCDEPDWCAWGLSFRDGALPMVAKLSEGEAPWLILAARVCERAAIDPLEALRYNAVAPATLLLEDEVYVLRTLLPAARLDPFQTLAAIDELGGEAARIRRRQSRLAPRRLEPALHYWVE
jgi:hypothetical protein